MKKRILTPLIASIFAAAICACQNNDMVRIAKNDTKGNADFMIDLYEAHLETDKAGTTRAVSTANVKPAVSITFDDATTACASAGKRLCTTLEWEVACEGMNSVAFGFQDSATSPKKVSDICNVGKSVGASTGVQTTGKATNCRSTGYNVSDMIGNVSEWTSKSNAPAVSGSNGFSDISDGANFDCHVAASASTADTSASLGFRCCKTP